MGNFFKPGQTVLFQGDSVTDCFRNAEGFAPYGKGYADKVVELYNKLYSDSSVSFVNRVGKYEGESYPPTEADSGVRFVNRGVSGNKTCDLIARYEKDFKGVAPDFVSVLIGVNEVLHHNLSMPETYYPPEKYESLYTELLENLHRDLPKCKIMIIEPFIIPNKQNNYDAWEKELIYIASAARRLALKYADYYLPMWGNFTNLICSGVEPVELSKDGIHPTPAGHSFIAREYLKALEII